MPPLILVVDDENVTRRLVSAALKTMNIEVIGAHDAARARTLLHENKVDLIITDINLPDVDGLSLIQELHSTPGLEHVPIISFTARNGLDDEQLVRQAGAVGFLTKPFGLQELREIVGKHLGQIP